MFKVVDSKRKYHKTLKSQPLDYLCVTLRKKCPYLELFCSAYFPHFPAFGLNTERYVFSPNAGKCGKHSGQNNSKCRLFLCSVIESYKIDPDTHYSDIIGIFQESNLAFISPTAQKQTEVFR